VQSKSLLPGGLVVQLLLRLSNVTIVFLWLLLIVLLLLFPQSGLIDVIYYSHECLLHVASIQSTCLYELNAYMMY
jgi:hypothetical protein